MPLFFNCDIVVCNADFPYAISNLIKSDDLKDSYTKHKVDNLNYSYSTFIIYLALDKKYDSLKTHNIYIGENFKENLQKPFYGSIPDEPSLYIYCPSKVDSNMCLNSKETLNIVLRVPNLSYKNISWDNDTIKNTRNKISA